MGTMYDRKMVENLYSLDVLSSPKKKAGRNQARFRMFLLGTFSFSISCRPLVCSSPTPHINICRQWIIGFSLLHAQSFHPGITVVFQDELGQRKWRSSNPHSDPMLIYSILQLRLLNPRHSEVERLEISEKLEAWKRL